jgi:hypothetical protein
MSLHCAMCRDSWPRERVGDRFIHRLPAGIARRKTGVNALTPGDRRRDGRGEFQCEADCLAVNDDQQKENA